MTASGNGSSALHVADVLRARAKALARPTAQAPESTLLEVLEFELARERYAVETRYVSEVCPARDLTPLPCTPPFVAGVVNVRGRIFTVLDLEKLFALTDNDATDRVHVVLVQGHGMELGLLSKAIIGVRSIAAETLHPSIGTNPGLRGEYLKGVTPERLIVLDLLNLLADPRIVVNEEVED